MEATARADSAMSQNSSSRRLFYFPLERMNDALVKGNVETVRHYESYFDEVNLVYFYGHCAQVVRRGKTSWRSVGGKHLSWDLAVAPWRMFRAASELKPTHFLSSDLVFSWWTSLLVRWLYRGRIVLMPISLPEDLYTNVRRSMTGMPIWLERLMMRLSFRAAAKIIISKQNKASIAWLRGDKAAARKLQVIDVIPEQYPPPQLLANLRQSAKLARNLHDPVRLLYVGRMHWQKLSIELVDMMHELSKRGTKARLCMAGDGADMLKMRERARQLDVDGNIEWLGFVDESKLAQVYRENDVFISTVTGTALREAALCGMPVVGYDVQFFDGLLRHEENALLVPVHDVAALAGQVAKVIADASLRGRIAANLHATISAGWHPSKIPLALQAAFQE